MASAFVHPALAGIAAGVVVRGLTLMMDRRGQFPTHPHGEIVHLFLGFVASTLGALAVPAILTGNYTAGVFLGLGTAQFHTVRGLEAGALLKFDSGDAVPRGPVYAEGIALAFEARNFLIFAIAAASCALSVWLGWTWGAAIGSAAGALCLALFRAERLGRLCDISLVEGMGPFPPADDPPDDGGERAKPVMIRFHARRVRSQVILRAPAQRQAILHDLHAGLGAALVAADGAQRTPEARYAAGGDLFVRMWPLITESARVIGVAGHIPVLEAIAAPVRMTAR